VKNNSTTWLSKESRSGWQTTTTTTNINRVAETRRRVCAGPPAEISVIAGSNKAPE